MYLIDAQTVPKCATFCADYGFIYAGLQWSTECYCDNAAPQVMAMTFTMHHDDRAS